MKLWLISQEVNNDYDTYSDAVVCAETEEEAQYTHPSEYQFYKWHDGAYWFQFADGTERNDGIPKFFDWCHPKDVKVQYIGEAASDIKAGVICASFHAG